ncbi:MAG: glutamyl-tRNA reductase [Thermoleophilia bacterium]|nr:glutamyl-tRNA reductase [Thermoleophilia bacterium]
MAEQRRTIVCIGASHQTASLAARERFALVGSKGRELSAHLAEHPDVLEVAALATCNRSELYVVAHDAAAVARAAIDAFAQLAEATSEEVATMLVVREDDEAVEHLLRVAGGIESVVTGEAQIQGQLRDTHEAAMDAKTCGPVLDRLFRLAVETGKRARTETTIGDGRASIGSIAAELVATRVGGLEEARMVVVGAGKMGGLAARSLAQRGVKRIDIVNRNEARAERVAASIGGGVGVGFDQLHAELVQSDAVVSSTNATHLVLRREMIEAVMAERPERPLVLVDLAVPRDIDATCAEIANVHVFDLDDLERVVAETLDVRTDAVEDVEEMARGGAEEFARWLRSLAATPAIREMRDRAEELRTSELERFLARMPHLTVEEQQRIDQLTRGIVNRLLHEPTVRLREAAAEQLS